MLLALKKEQFKLLSPEECREILDSYGPKSQIFDSIGYSETLKYLNEEIDKIELASLIAMHTKQLAKKQMTFLRRFPVKHGMACSPEQSLDSSQSKTKPSRVDFKSVKLSMDQLCLECQKFLQNSSQDTQNRVVYLDAPAILQALAVS